MWGLWDINHEDASAPVAQAFTLYNIEVKRVVLYHLMEKLPFRKRQGLVGDHFTKGDVIKKLPEILQQDITDIPQLVKLLRNIQPFFADLHGGGLSIAHNGNLTNAKFKKYSCKRRCDFRTTSDTETIVQLIAKSKEKTDKIIDAMFQIHTHQF